MSIYGILYTAIIGFFYLVCIVYLFVGFVRFYINVCNEENPWKEKNMPGMEITFLGLHLGSIQGTTDIATMIWSCIALVGLTTLAFGALWGIYFPVHYLFGYLFG